MSSPGGWTPSRGNWTPPPPGGGSPPGSGSPGTPGWAPSPGSWTPPPAGEAPAPPSPGGWTPSWAQGGTQAPPPAAPPAWQAPASAGPPSGSKKRIGVIVGIVAVVVVAVVIVVLVLANSSTSGVNYDTLRTGDCFNRTSGPKEGKVDCSAPHQVEVTGTFEISASSYPGESGMRPQAEQTCTQKAASYLGTHSTAGLEVVWLVPAKGSWNDGIRTVVCGVQNIDGSKRSGSTAG